MASEEHLRLSAVGEFDRLAMNRILDIADISRAHIRVNAQLTSIPSEFRHDVYNGLTLLQ